MNYFEGHTLAKYVRGDCCTQRDGYQRPVINRMLSPASGSVNPGTALSESEASARSDGRNSC